MPEFRHMRTGSLSIPGGAAPPGNGHLMPRSPPNTSHVPCKFFRQGACQAGNACPFSHELGSSGDNVCKYFAKGNCKFGPKCANVHVLPDGRRINYGKNGVTIGTTPISLAGRPSPTPGSPSGNSSASALTTSLFRADQPPYSPFGDDRHQHRHGHLGRQPSLDNGLSGGDSLYPHSVSNYGSPRDEDSARFGFGLSPVNGKGLSVLDAPLPASFDSNGISNAARFPAAPWPSSVPSKFGLESPTPSLSNAKDSRTSETLKLLHTSAFGSSEHLATPTAGSPTGSQFANGDEYYGKRAMHSSRYAKPRMLSSSLPKTTSVDRDWEAGFAFGDDGAPENYVPENLQDLLTPAEKARRGSMRGENDLSIDGLSKYGSPAGSSPSRWGPLFHKQKEEEEMSRSARNAASAFGHVGSPLRNSTLAQEMGGEFGTATGTSRPSATRTGSEGMSVLSQQLQRTRIDDGVGNANSLLHPTNNRLNGGGVGTIGRDRPMERHVSTGSISSSVTGRFTTPIDEEDPAFVFSMEEEDESSVAKMRKRGSAGLSMGSIASYAGAASRGVTNGSKESRDSMPVNGQ